MADNIKIDFDINFNENSAQKSLEDLINNLKKNNKIDLVINTDTFKKTENQFKQLRDEISKSMDFNMNVNSDGLNKTEFKLDKLVKKQVETNEGFKTFERSVSTTNKELEKTVNITEKLDTKTGQVKDTFKTVTDNTGKLNKELEKSLEKTQQKIDKTILKREENIRKLERNQANAINKSLDKEWTKNNSSIFKDIKSLNTDIFNAKKNIIKSNDIPSLKEENVLYKEQLKTLYEIRQEKIQDLVKNGGFSEERQLDLSKQIQKNLFEINKIEKLNTIEKQKQNISLKEDIAKYKEMSKINLRNLKTRYGSLLETDDIKPQIESFKRNLEQLDSKKGMEALNLQFKDLKSNITASDKALRVVKKDAMSFGDLLKTDMARITTYFGSWKVFTLAMQVFKEGIADTIEFNSQMTTLNMTMTGTKESFKSLAISTQETAKALGTTVDKAMEATATYANMTETIDTLREKVKAPLVLSNISGMNVADSTNSIQGISKEFQLAEDEGMRVADILSAVSANIAVDFKKGTQGITEAVKASGAVAKEAGFDLEGYTAIVSQLMENTRESGSTIGNGLKQILARIYRIKDASTDITEKDMADTERALKRFKINIRDVGNDLKPAPQLLLEITEKWKNMNQAERSQLAEAMGGTRRKTFVIDMLNNMSRSQELYQDALNSTNFALKANEKYLDSNKAKIQGLKAQLQIMFEKTVDSDGLNRLIEISSAFIGVVDKLTSKFGLLGVTLGSIFAIGGNKLKSLSFVKNIFKDLNMSLANFEKLLYKVQVKINTTKFNGFAKGNTGELQKKIPYLKRLSLEYKKLNAEVAKNIGLTNGQQVAGITKVINGLRAWTVVTLGQTHAQQALKVATIGVNMALGLMAGAIISKACTWIDKMIHKQERLRESMEELKNSVSSNIQQARGTINELDGMKNEYNELSKKTHKTANEQKRFNDIQNKIADIAPETISYYDEQGNAVLNLKNGVDGLIDSYKEKIKLENMKLLSESDNIDEVNTEEIKKTNEKLNEQIKERKELRNELEMYKNARKGNLLGISYDKEIDKVQQKISSLDNKIATSKQKLSMQKDYWKNSIRAFLDTDKGFEKLDGNMKKVVSNFANTSNFKSIGQAEIEVSKLIKTLNSAKTQPLTSQINQLNIDLQNGKVSAKEYNNKIKDIVKSLSKITKIDKNVLKDLFEVDTTKIKEATESVENAKVKIDELKQSMQDSQNEIKDMNGFLNELNENHELSASSVAKIITEYPELIDYLNDEHALRSKLNDKINEQVDVNKRALLEMKKDDENYYNNKILANEKMVNEIKQAYGIDLTNYKTLAQAKEAVDDELLSALADKWGDFIDTQADIMSDQVINYNQIIEANGGAMSKGVMNIIGSVRKDVGSAREKMKGFKNRIGSITFDGVTASLGKLGAQTDKNTKSTKQNNEMVNQAKEAVKAYDTALKQLHATMAQIDIELSHLYDKSPKYIAKLEQKQRLIREEIKLNKQQIGLNNQMASSLGGEFRTYTNNSTSTLGQDVVNKASNFLGTPYVWGGTSPNGFDCSGLVQYVYNQVGKQLSRTTYTQIKEGSHVDKNNLQQGDLVFFGTPSDPHHVGMYAGNGNYIHAPKTGDVVKISSLASRGDYLEGRRIINPSSAMTTSNHSVVNEEMDLKGKAFDLEKRNMELEDLIHQINIQKVNAKLGMFDDIQKSLDKSLNQFRQKVDLSGQYNTTHNAWLRKIQEYDKTKLEKFQAERKFIEAEMKSGQYDEKTIEMLRQRNSELGTKMLEMNKELKNIGYEIANARWEGIKSLYETNMEMISNEMSRLQLDEEKNIKGIAQLKQQIVEQDIANIQRITNLIKELNKEEEKYDRQYLFDKITEYNKELDKANTLLAQHKKELEDVHKKQKEIVNTIEEKVKSAILKMYDLEKEQIDKITKHKLDAIDEEIKKMDEAEKRNSYAEQKTEQLNKIKDLQSKIAKLSLDDSSEGMAKRLEYERQLKEEMNKKDDMQMKHSIEQQKESLKNMKDNIQKNADNQKRDIDTRMDNYYVNLETKQSLAQGYIMDINGKAIDIQKALMDYLDYYENGVLSIGDTIKKQILEQLNSANKLLKEAKDITSNNKGANTTKNVYGSRIDLDSAKAILGIKGYNYIDTSMVDMDKINLGANDVVLGGDINRKDLNGATRIAGSNRQETAEILKLYKDVADGKIKPSNGIVYGSGVDLYNAMKWLSPLGYEFVDTDKINVNDVAFRDNDLIVGGKGAINGINFNTNAKRLGGSNRFETDKAIREYALNNMRSNIGNKYDPQAGTVYGKDIDLALAKKYLSKYGYKFVETDNVADLNLNENDIVVGGQVKGQDRIYNNGANWLWGNNRLETESAIRDFSNYIKKNPAFDDDLLDKVDKVTIQNDRLLDYIQQLPQIPVQDLKYQMPNMNLGLDRINGMQTNNKFGDTTVVFKVDNMYGTKEEALDFGDSIMDVLKSTGKV